MLDFQSGAPLPLYGLLGHRLGHSFSPGYFSHKFKKEGIAAAYRLFDTDNLESFFSRLAAMEHLRGFNVTIPYKKDVMGFLDVIDPVAVEIGAVNVVRVVRRLSGIRLEGHNTDWAGFLGSLRKRFGTGAFSGALILGTGGASGAVAYALRHADIPALKVSRLAGGQGIIGYDDISADVLNEFNLVINTTPAGMWPDTTGFPPLPYHLIGSRNVCFDLIYNPEQTCFMKMSMARGARVAGGLDMLERQAELSWAIWNS